jgi:flavin reductase (DIM6/NTAB) family NADH-FMN oxidoreductase RutF
MARDLTLTKGPSPRAAAPADFTEAMSALAGGVVLVTSWLDGRPWGMTVSAVASISAQPPTILVSLCTGTASAASIAQARSFGVSILASHHGAAARHGSRRGASKFLERFVDADAGGSTPAVAGALAHLDCDLVERFEVEDHTIFIGRVRDVQKGSSCEPLVYFRRAYRSLASGRRSRCLSN